ncbi:MAG: LysR family transcriptional regulator [Rhizobiaceae bacterium]
MHNNRWSDLEYILAVAAKGSLAAAARELNVNHSTVQRRVQAFERQTNIKIFERLRSGYRPTPEGEMFLDAAQSIETIVNDLDRKIVGSDKGLSGQLSITTTDAIFPALAADISAFQLAHPKIITDIIITNDRLDLDRRDADIAIRASNQPPPHLVGRRVCGVNFGVYATQPVADEMAQKPIDRRQWLGLEYPLRGSPAGEWMDAEIPASRVALRASSFTALCELAGHGLGHVILPRHVGEASPKLVQVPYDLGLPAVGLWLLSHRDILRSPRVRIATDFLYNSLRRKQTEFEGPGNR